MKSIFSTCILFLVLPLKPSGETTIWPIGTKHETTQRGDEYTILSTTITEDPLKPSGNGLDKSTSRDRETAQGFDGPIILSTKNTKDLLKTSGGTTHSFSSTGLDKSTSRDRETAQGFDGPIILSTKNTKDLLKPSGGTTHSFSSTELDKGTSKDQETTTRSDEPTTFFTKNQEQHTNEKSKNALSSKSPPQTTTMTSMSQAEHLATEKTMSRGESRSDLLQSSTPLSEVTKKQNDSIILTTQNMSKEGMTTRDEHLALNNFKSTNKGLERHIQGNKTTRSAGDESFKTKTVISTHFQKLEVITHQLVQTTETLSSTRASLPWEKESTHHLILNTNVSNSTSSEERNDTASYPLNTSTTTIFSTGHSPTVNTGVATTGTTETMDAKTTYEIPTKAITRKEMNPSSNSKTTVTIFRDSNKSTKSTTIKDKNNQNIYPGPIVAALIGSIICIMFIALVVVWVRNHQKRKMQMDNPDWAGPSPFIEGNIHPNLPTISEDGPFQRRESKRISLHSFLPQQLSNRLSMLSPMDEEVPLGSTQLSNTFGQYNAQPLNGNASQDQMQTPEANSPPVELSSNSDVPETENVPPALENKEIVQTTTKLDDEITQSPPTKTNNDTSTPFEDVDLNLSPEQNTETTSPSDDTNTPSPPSITTS